MRKNQLLGVIVCLFFLACKPGANKQAADESDSTAVAGHWVTYSGLLPCADCDGIETALQLHAADFSFKLKEIYKGLGSGTDQTLTSEGSYAIIKGSTIHPEATVVQLNPEKDRNLQRFFQQDGDTALVQLDASERPTAGILRKTN